MDAHYIRITSSWKMYKQCIPYLTGKFSKLCSNKKSHYGFKVYPYPNILLPGQFMLPYYVIKAFFLTLMSKRGGGKLVLPPQLLKVGRMIAPNSFTHKVRNSDWYRVHDSYGASEFMSDQSFSGVNCLCCTIFSFLCIRNFFVSH